MKGNAGSRQIGGYVAVVGEGKGVNGPGYLGQELVIEDPCLACLWVMPGLISLVPEAMNKDETAPESAHVCMGGVQCNSRLLDVRLWRALQLRIPSHEGQPKAGHGALIYHPADGLEGVMDDPAMVGFEFSRLLHHGCD